VNEERRLLRLNHRRETFEKALSQWVRARSWRRLSYLVDEQVKRLGGIDQVAKTWHDCVRRAMDSKRDHLVLRSFTVLFKMMELGQKLQPTVIGEMSDAELDVFLGDALAAQIQRNPEELAKLLESQGYVVIRPANGVPPEPTT